MKLEAATIARKATGDRLLREADAMARSYDREVVSDYEAAVGSGHPKATWQELGTSRAVPPGPILETAAVKKEDEVQGILGEKISGTCAG